MDLELADDLFSIRFALRGAIGIATGVLIVVLVDTVYGVPDGLLSLAVVAVAGGFGSGVVTATTMLPGPQSSDEGNIVDEASVIAGASQFVVFFIAALMSNPATDTAGPFALVFAAVVFGLLMSAVGFFAGGGGALFVLSLVPTDSPVFTNPSQMLPEAERIPATLSLGIASRLPLLLYLPIAVVILGGEWVFKLIGGPPLRNEYLTMRVDTTAIGGLRLREDLPETATYTVPMDFAGYQPAFDFLNPILTSFALPSDLVGLILALFGSTIVDTILFVVYYVLYLVSVVGILELLLPLLLVASVVLMLPSYKTGLPIWVFICNIAAVGMVAFTLLFLGPMPLIGVGVTYELGVLGQLHLLALLTHAVTGVAVLHFVTDS